MAGRPPKESLDFSSWDVSILDNDEKIDMLIDSQGIGAFTIYFYLCQKAYGTKGYYLEWSYSRCATIARKLGKGASADFVKNVVDKCFQCCLFDKRLFELHGILTSKGIQRKFAIVAKERTAPKINEEFWLLDDKESAGLVFHAQKLNYEGSKSNYGGSKSNYQPLKESKGKKSKVNESKAEERIENSAGSESSAAAVCFREYEKYMGQITPTVAEGIEYYIGEGMTAELINRIIQYSCEQNKRSWQYINAALLGNLNEGIRTLDEYTRHQAERAAKGRAAPRVRSKFNNYNDTNAVPAMTAEEILKNMLEEAEE